MTFNNSDKCNILDALPLAILLTNIEGNIVFCNKKSGKILGYTSQELQTMNIEQLIPPSLKISHQQLIKKYFSNPSDRAMNKGRQLSALNKNKQLIDLQIGLSSITLNQQTYTMISIIEADNKVIPLGAFHDPLTGLSNRILFAQLSSQVQQLAIRN